MTRRIVRIPFDGKGYEIKVSEAISQGKWIIGTRAGGIPLQIREGVDGDLVDPGDPKGELDPLSTSLLESLAQAGGTGDFVPYRDLRSSAQFLRISKAWTISLGRVGGKNS